MVDAIADHPKWVELQAFGQGKLAPEDASAVEGHLALCATCCDRLAETPADSFLHQLRSAGSPSSARVGPSALPPGVPPELADNPRYRVLELIGRGGMGAVYRAEHRRMERLVALKVIHPRLMCHAEMVQRFRQEVRAAARLDHANIVTAHDADQAGELHFLVMEYVEGTSLAEQVAARGPLPVDLACEYVRQAALGLQHAHEQGLVHRDIKPHNLMLTPEGRVKILDFGLARLSHDGAIVPGELPEGALTGTGTVMGTADYISPEQAADPHAADIRADVYSLGCTLFHLLTGKVPYPSGSVAEKLARHANGPFPSLRERRPEIPPALESALARMTAKAPADRFATPAEVARSLAPFCRPARPPLWRRRLPVAAALASAVAALALIVPFLHRDPEVVAPNQEGREPVESPRDATRRAAEAKKTEADAIRVVEKLGGRIRRDEAIPGKPVTLVILAGTTVKDADLAALSAFGRLGTLDLARTAIGDGGLRHLEGLEHLTSLVLVGTRVTDAGMKTVGTLRRLEDLELQNTAIGDDGLSRLARLTNLRRLSLHQTKVTDGAMADVAKMKRLTHLTLSETHVTDEGLKALTGLAGLTQLGLFHVWNVGDEGMKSVAKLGGLRTLDLCGTKVTDRGLKELAGCTKLESLRLGGRPITDAGVAALSTMDDLAYLDLSGSGITDRGVAVLSRHRRLTGLDLRGAKAVTDAGVKELAGLPALNNLVLSGTAVTDAGLGELARCRSLEFLNLRDTAGVTAGGVQALQTARSRLRIER